MTLTRGFVRNAVTTPLDARLMDMAQVVGNADGSARPGVMDADGRNIVTALATMNVAVAAADFVTSKGTADGVAIFTNDGTVNVPITAAPASNSRIDVIYVKHNDNTTGDANSTPIFAAVAGVAAASPTKPAIPTGALELATLRVYAGTTAANGGANVLTNTYAMTTSRGGIVPFRTLADLTAWTNPLKGQVAQTLDDLSADAFYRWNGTAWRHLSRVLGVTTVATPTVQSGISTETDVTGMTVTFNVPRTGRVRVAAGLQTLGADNGSAIVIRLKEGATTVAEWIRMANSSPFASTGNYANVERVVEGVTAGTHTWRIAVARVVGGEVAVAPGAPAALSQITVEMFD